MVHWSVLSSKITPWCELLYYGSFWLGWVGRIFLTQALSHPSASTSAWTSKQVTSFLQNSLHNPSYSSYPTIFQLHFNLQNKVVLCSTHWTVHHQSLTTSASTVPNLAVMHLDIKKKNIIWESSSLNADVLVMVWPTSCWQFRKLDGVVPMIKEPSSD